MGQPRVFYSMSKDGLLPEWAAKIHPRYQTPHVTTAITGTIVAILAGFVPIHMLGELVSIGTLFAFVIVGTGIIILRASNPGLHRPFKVPLSPVIPILTVWIAAFLMNNLPLDTWLRLIVWMSIGLVIYFAYSYNNSKLAKERIDHVAGEGAALDYKPPVAAILAVLGTIVLTIWQVEYFLPNTTWIDTAVRLFAWSTTGILVAMLMYGKGDRSAARSQQVRNIGLLASVVNLALWVAVFYWFLTQWADYHKAA
jgi:amino acid transporter